MSGDRGSDSQLLNEILVEYLQALEAGESPNRQELMARHPELADQLREFLAQHDRLQQAAPQSDAASDKESTIPAAKQQLGEATLAGAASGAAMVGGTRTFGDYELLEEIAHGGMGVVYKARQISLNRVVALKMILAGQLASPEDILRFHAEAEAAANLDHPGIVPIHEVGVQDGQHYFSMGFVDGSSLAAKLVGGPLPPRQAAEVIRKIAEAVAYAHEHGVIHRDLKPANVLVDEHGEPRVTDFGLAKRVQGGSDMTRSGQILGTPSYMPPEQASGKVDAAKETADVYALGAILYTLMTGRPPFQADNPLDTLLQVLEQQPVSPRTLNATIPKDLETICLKCLEKSSRQRYASAEALAEELERFLSDEPIQARPISAPARSWRWCRRNPAVAGLAASVVLALLGGTAVSAYYAIQAAAKSRQYLAEQQRAAAAEEDAIDKLWSSYLAQARAGRWSERPGRRFDSLEALKKAAAIRPSRELRNEAIACMALPDLRVRQRWTSADKRMFGTCTGDLKLNAWADTKGNVTVRNMDSGKVVLRVPGFGNLDVFSQFSPDGRFLSINYVKRAHIDIWDLADRRKWLSLKELFPEGYTMDFSRDSRLFATAARDGSIEVTDLKARQRMQRLAVVARPYMIRFSPEGCHLAVSSRTGDVHVLEAGGTRSEQTLRHPAAIRGVAWSPDGKLLCCACADFNIYAWKAGSYEQPSAELRGHLAEVVHVNFNRRGNILASTSWDGSRRLWDPWGRKQLLTSPTGPGQGPAWFSDDDQRMPFDGFFEFGILDVASGEEFLALHGHEGYKGPWSLEFSPDGRLIASAGSDGVRLWDALCGCHLAYLPTDYTQFAAFHPNGRSLLTSGAAGVCCWPLVRSEHAGRTRLRVGPPVTLLQLASEDVRQYRQTIGYAGLSANGRVLCVQNVKQAIIFRTQDGVRWERHSVISGQPGLARPAISVDGQWIATAALWGSGVWIWNAGSGRVKKRLLSDVPTTTAGFSPDGRWLVTGDGQAYQIWEVGTWHLLRSMDKEKATGLGYATFSPDSKILAIFDLRGVVRLIEVNTGRELARLEPPHTHAIRWLRFSPDGSQLAAAATDHQVLIWDLHRICKQLAEINLLGDMPLFARSPVEHPEPILVDVDLGED